MRARRGGGVPVRPDYAREGYGLRVRLPVVDLDGAQASWSFASRPASSFRRSATRLRLSLAVRPASHSRSTAASAETAWSSTLRPAPVRPTRTPQIGRAHV